MRTPTLAPAVFVLLAASVVLTSSPSASSKANGAPNSKPTAAAGPGRAYSHFDVSHVTLTPPADVEQEPVKALPDVGEYLETHDEELDPKLVDLGERLFHDPRLSTDNTISCASCHDLRYGGVDRAPTATGIRGQVGPINTPTVFNSVLSIAQFWDGRAHDLAAQAGGPPLAPGEMGSSWAEIVGKIAQDQTYVDAFVASFPKDVKGAKDIEHEQLLEAIAAFETTLLTPDSRFDQWLEGDERAITLEERQGYELFKEVGCATCHYGPQIGGRSFQRLGAKRDFFTDAARVSHVDHGRYNVTRDDRDKHVFKVPTLRNVAITGPWFHDGSMRSLDEAIDAMAFHQLDVRLSPADRAKIAAFLGTLTGKYRGHYLDQSLEGPK